MAAMRLLLISLVLVAVIEGAPSVGKKSKVKRGVGQPAILTTQPLLLPEDGTGVDEGALRKKRWIGKPAGQRKLVNMPQDIAEDKKKRQYFYYYYSYFSSPQELALSPTSEWQANSEDVIDHADDGGTGKAPGCLPKYEEMERDHTMCVYADDPSVNEYGIIPEDIELIVKMHNDYRAMEKAEDMAKMYWDDELAVVAQKLAQSCHKGHDENHERLVPGWNIEVGQNWCGGVKTWQKCMELWHGEIVNFVYGVKAKGITGHYTQMVNDKAVAIGCGYAYCPDKHRQNYVCNYAYGQSQKDVRKPFARGEPCDQCPNHCVNNVCDCGAKVCMNKGQLNKKRCECICQSAFFGENCEHVDCSKEDGKNCGKGEYVKEKCFLYKNLPSICPRECGFCVDEK